MKTPSKRKRNLFYAGVSVALAAFLGATVFWFFAGRASDDIGKGHRVRMYLLALGNSIGSEVALAERNPFFDDNGSVSLRDAATWSFDPHVKFEKGLSDRGQMVTMTPFGKLAIDIKLNGLSNLAEVVISVEGYPFQERLLLSSEVLSKVR